MFVYKIKIDEFLNGEKSNVELDHKLMVVTQRNQAGDLKSIFDDIQVSFLNTNGKEFL